MKVYALTAKKIKGATWGSKLIMWHEKLNFSHVALYFDDVEPFIFESVAPLSRKIYYNQWLVEYIPVEKYLLAEVDVRDVDIFIQCMQNIPYSLGQIFSIIINALVKSLFKKSGLISIQNGEVICTEVYTMFVRIFRGYNFDGDKDLVDLNSAYKSIKYLELT